MDYESVYRCGYMVFVRYRFVPGLIKRVECDMNTPTEKDRIAARALAKRLVAELSAMEWHRKGNESECSQRVADAVKRESMSSGLSPLLLKSYMMRLQRGEV